MYFLWNLEKQVEKVLEAGIANAKSNTYTIEEGMIDYSLFEIKQIIIFQVQIQTVNSLLQTLRFSLQTLQRLKKSLLLVVTNWRFLF